MQSKVQTKKQVELTFQKYKTNINEKMSFKIEVIGPQDAMLYLYNKTIKKIMSATDDFQVYNLQTSKFIDSIQCRGINYYALCWGENNLYRFYYKGVEIGNTMNK